MENNEPTKYSTNELAEKIVGKRNTAGFPLDQPGELGFTCPCCKNEQLVKGGFYDERLNWSEYNGFLWCGICNKDYPSVLCCGDNIDKAIEIYLSAVLESQIRKHKDIAQNLNDNKLEVLDILQNSNSLQKIIDGIIKIIRKYN